MASPAPEKDRKKQPQQAAAKPAKDAAKPELAREKGELGAMLRPDAAAPEGGALKVGGKSDKAEKEADKVADAVLKDKAEAPAKEGKKKPEEGKEGEEPAHLRPEARGPPALTPVGPKLVVDNTRPDTVRRVAQGGQPNTDELTAVPSLPGNMSEVSVSGAEESLLDEMNASDFEQLGQGENLQPKFMPGQGREGGFALGGTLSDRIRDTRGGGMLPAALRARIEDRLGVDLSAVRVHAGAEATQMCRAIGARAFAHGRNIWLRSGADISDARLMAHEVVHTVQQGAAPPLARVAPPRPAARQADPRPSRPHSRSAAPTGDNMARAPPTAAPSQTATVRRLSDDDDPGMLARGAESLADRLDSYGVLKVLIGRRLFTGQTVNPSAVDYVGAFMKFIGADETFEQMKQSGSLQRGFDAIREGLTTYDITWDRVRRTFARAEDEFDWWSPIDSFKSIFGPFFSDVVDYGVMVLKIIAELVAEAFVIGFGPMGRAVWDKIKAIGDTIGLIIADPLGFAMNLIRAVARGIQGFGERIWEHIKSGLLAWILGPFAAMGIELPEKLDLKGIISVVLQVLGLTYPQLRPRIVRALEPNGEVKVSVVERIIEVVNILRTEGLAGIWRKVLEYVQNLQMTVINGIRDWVVQAVVQAGIRKLVAWSNPAGALIDILLTIYNLIVFFVERFQQILDFASSIFDSLGKIARGQLNDAALAVEASMAKTIPIIISFMVRLLGLPDIGGTIRRIITNLQARVHAAFDKLLEWLVKKVKKLIAKLVDKFRRGEPSEHEGFEMDGERHEMWAEDSSKRIVLTMASDQPGPVADDASDKTKENFEDSADHTDSAGASEINQVDAAHDAAKEERDRLNAQPEVNRSTPKAREEMQAKVKPLTEELEQASRRPPNAAEIDDDSGENDDPPPQEAALDRTDYPMRQRIRTTIKVEGAAGDWAAMTAVYDQAKTEAPNPADIYANLARDHVPEFTLLTKVSRLHVPGLNRKGEPVDLPLFPKLKEAVGHLEDKRAAGNRTLPVIIIRQKINSDIKAISGHLGDFGTLHRKEGSGNDGEKWIPKQFDTDVTDAQRPAAATALAAKYGAEALITDMQAHVDQIKTLYAGLPDGSIEADFDSHVTSRATPVLQQITRALYAGEATTDLSTEGAAAGLNIPYDEELANGELAMEPYSQLPPIGLHMQRHHLVEKNIVEKLRDRAKDLTLASVMGAEGESLVTSHFNAAKAGLGAEQKQAIDSDEGKAAQADGVKQALSAALSAVELKTDMKTGQSAQAQGIAINVLSTVNQQAATQPDSNIGAALDPKLAQFRSTHATTVRNATMTRLSNALVQIAAGTPPDMAGLQQQLTEGIAGKQGDMNTELKSGWTQTMTTLSDTAYDTFHALQQTTIDEMNANEGADVQNRSAPMLQRFNALTKPTVAGRNVSQWFS